MRYNRYNWNSVYTADFEATTEEPITAYMFSWCNLYKKGDRGVKIGTDSARKFLEWARTLEENSIIFFFNMHYDWAIFRSWSFYNGTEKWLPKFEDFIHPSSKRIIESKLIYPDGKVVYVRDQYCLFNAPLKNVMRDYTDLKKGNTPIFKTVNDIEYKNEHVEYCLNDSVGAAKALEKRLNIGGNKKTTASGAMYEFKSIIKQKGKNLFKKLFPELSIEQDTTLRKAYQGGYCYVKPSVAGVKITTPEEVIDCNSIYPFCMLKKMPYGEPLVVDKGKVKTNGQYDLGLQRFVIKNAQVKEGCIAFLTTGGCSRYGAKNYNECISENEPIEKRTFMLPLQEFELFQESYEYDKITYLGGFLFKSSDEIFKDYIDKMSEMKMSDVPSIRSNGKLFMNSLYGKFGENPVKKPCHVEFVDGIIKIKADEPEESKGGYIPIAIFVTSYARCHLIENIYRIGYDNFLYCDTDSIHMLKTPNIEKIDIHPKRFGAWKNETDGNIITESCYIRTKRYVQKYTDGTLHFACAGIKNSDLIEQVKSVDEFKVGKVIHTVKGFMGVGGVTFKEVEVRI